MTDCVFNPECLPELLPVYYKRLFPYGPYYRWLSYGNGRSRLLCLYDLVWFGLFVHPFSHICNIGHVNYRLRFATQFIIYGHPHNIINNNTKFKDQLEIKFVTTSRYMCIYTNIHKS
jgi:hypothetical protein